MQNLQRILKKTLLVETFGPKMSAKPIHTHSSLFQPTHICEYAIRTHLLLIQCCWGHVPAPVGRPSVQYAALYIIQTLCLSEAQKAKPHITSTSHNEPKECGDLQEQNWQEMWRIL